MYLTWQEYTDLGGTLDFTAYPTYEFEARSLIDYWTFNRLQNEQNMPEAVKFCMYKLISLAVTQNNILSANPTLSNDNDAAISSQSNDGVSISYNTMSASDVYQATKIDADRLVKQYLSGVKNSLGHDLLYRGVYPNEC